MAESVVGTEELFGVWIELFVAGAASVLRAHIASELVRRWDAESEQFRLDFGPVN